MATKLELLEAEHEAEKVVASHPFSAFPICPFAIAEKAGIVVQPKDSKEPGVSGFLMRVGDTFGIQYATHIANEGFIRFTIAHELGHYFLPGHPEKLFSDGKILHHSRSGYVSGDPLERQADHFASSLLMPQKLFTTEVNRGGKGFEAIERLADVCKTSITATAIRFVKFTDDPVAVVVSTGDRVDFCFISDRIRDLRGLSWIKKGDPVPSNSTTASFNDDPDNVIDAATDEGTSFLDEWFDGAPQIEMNEDVVGLGSYGKTLTVLFTDEDLEDEDASDEDDY